MTSASPVSDHISSPLAGEEGARAAQSRGKVRGMVQRQREPTSAIDRARQLRRNATDAEKRLWAAFREKLPAAKFRRQVPIGSYFVDFVSHAARFIVEVDGGQHAIQQDHDQRRTAFLNGQGYSVLRVWNHEVIQNLDAVLAMIAAALPPHPPTPRGAGPSLSHKGRGA